MPRSPRRAARLIAQRGGIKKAGRPDGLEARGRTAVRAPHALSRRCVIKATICLHDRERPQDRGRRISPTWKARRRRARWIAGAALRTPTRASTPRPFGRPLDGEPRQFRFIVSPEDVDLLDPAGIQRGSPAGQVEKDTGRRLEWAAVNHHNTDNPHVHVVVRGLDRDGDEVRIDGRYIAQGMRWRAQEIVTRELGRRPEIELSTVNQEVGRVRFTNLDRAIEPLVTPEGTVSLEHILREPGGDGRLCIARLEDTGDAPPRQE